MPGMAKDKYFFLVTSVLCLIGIALCIYGAIQDGAKSTTGNLIQTRQAIQKQISTPQHRNRNETSEKPLNILILMGSVREERLCSRMTKFVTVWLEKYGHNIVLFDPEEMNFELLRKPLHFYEDRKDAPEWLQKADNVVRSVDAYVIVTPEYNAGIPPALCNMMDHFPPSSYSFKPSGIISYTTGSHGAQRVAMVLRPFLAELQTVAIPYVFSIPYADGAIDNNGSAINVQVIPNVQTFITQLEWYARAMRHHRENSIE